MKNKHNLKVGDIIYLRHWVNNTMDQECKNKDAWWCIGFFVRFEGELIIASSTLTSPAVVWKEYSLINPFIRS